MALTFDCPYPQAINNVAGQILPADTTSKKTIFTAGANGSILKSLGITSTDSSSRIVQLSINVGGAGTDEFWGAVTVPITAGTDGTTSAVDVMRSAIIPWMSYDAFGNKVMYLKAGTTIKANCTTTVTTAKELDFNGEGLDF